MQPTRNGQKIATAAKSSGMPLEKQARIEEAAWRARTPAAHSVPVAQPLPTRAERRALRELADETAEPNSPLRKRLDERRLQAREDERVRERSRARPFKHLPRGVGRMYFSKHDGVVEWADKETPNALYVLGGETTEQELAFKRVTPELARSASALARAFSAVEAYDQATFVGDQDKAQRMLVPRELVEAIENATRAMGTRWISVLLQHAELALLETVSKKHGATTFANDLRDPVTPKQMLKALRHECGSFPPPADVDEALVGRVLARLKIGGGGGGGSSRRVSHSKMRQQLANPTSRSKL